MQIPFASALCAALMLVSAEPAAQRVAASLHGPSVRVSASYSHAPRRVWVPGHHETRLERVWVPGCSERVWIEPRFELRLGTCNTWIRVEVEPGHWRTYERPGRYELREVRVWVPGHYAERARCD